MSFDQTIFVLPEMVKQKRNWAHVLLSKIFIILVRKNVGLI